MSAPKVDLSKLSEEERIFFSKYGRLPPQKKDVLNSRLKGERKYFDSGDYALSKAGKSSATDVGSQHPSPERIPHSVPTNLKKAPEGASSPIKESNLIHEAAVAEQSAQ
ncbi:camp-regulated phosphoprotein/endosulfine conserved region-domain-containing protein [Cladochytrium replicatum]|nr:camp-regulated phosphoprotein/endosulfine conserved region-domain-containing protein [Cladochytrium replicatum]